MLLLGVAAWANAAWAFGGADAPPSPGMPGEGAEAGSTAPQKAKILADYFTDLGGDEAGERAFAARYLLGELRRHTWTYEHAQPGSIANLDARSALTELDARLPDACESALLFQNSAVFCAEILAVLERAELTEQVAAAASRARNKAEIRRFAAAFETLRLIGGTPVAASPTASPNVGYPPVNPAEASPPPPPAASP